MQYQFQLVSNLSVLVALLLGWFLGRMLRNRFPRIEFIVYGVGIWSAALMFYLAFFHTELGSVGFLTLVFFGHMLLHMNKQVVAVMAVVSTRLFSSLMYFMFILALFLFCHLIHASFFFEVYYPTASEGYDESYSTGLILVGPIGVSGTFGHWI